tara:strand:- start:963 stop:1442 length:480 start_codon:yes stop_codon:yes gene_type:complete
MNVEGAQTTLKIKTTLDVKELYKESITSVVFNPSNLKLKVSQDKKKFDDVVSTLRIETDIPNETIDIPYIAKLTKNTTICTDYSGEENEQQDFVKLTIDNNDISVGDQIRFKSFNDSDGSTKASKHEINLSFSPFKSITTKGLPESCSGEVNFDIEVDI